MATGCPMPCEHSLMLLPKKELPRGGGLSRCAALEAGSRVRPSQGRPCPSPVPAHVCCPLMYTSWFHTFGDSVLLIHNLKYTRSGNHFSARSTCMGHDSTESRVIPNRVTGLTTTAPWRMATAPLTLLGLQPQPPICIQTSTAGLPYSVRTHGPNAKRSPF